MILEQIFTKSFTTLTWALDVNSCGVVSSSRHRNPPRDQSGWTENIMKIFKNTGWPIRLMTSFFDNKLKVAFYYKEYILWWKFGFDVNSWCQLKLEINQTDHPVNVFIINALRLENLEVDARRVERAPGRPHPVYFSDVSGRRLVHSPVAILRKISS